MTYKCKNSFYVPWLDEDGGLTEKYDEVPKDSIWRDEDNNYIGESDVRLFKVGGNCKFDCIDMSYENLKEDFEEVRK